MSGDGVVVIGGAASFRGPRFPFGGPTDFWISTLRAATTWDSVFRPLFHPRHNFGLNPGNRVRTNLYALREVAGFFPAPDLHAGKWNPLLQLLPPQIIHVCAPPSAIGRFHRMRIYLGLTGTVKPFGQNSHWEA